MRNELAPVVSHVPTSTALLITQLLLTHWGRVTHISVSEPTIIGSDNGLSPGRRQAIIWNNDGLLLIEPRTNFSEISIGIQTFSFNKMHLDVSSAEWRLFCLGLNVLRYAANESEQQLTGTGRIQLGCLQYTPALSYHYKRRSQHWVRDPGPGRTF